MPPAGRVGIEERPGPFGGGGHEHRREQRAGLEGPHAGRTGAGRIDGPSRAVVPPVHVTATYLRDPDNQYRSGNVYGRDNETVREAEALIASLEGAAAAMLLGSGMSAATALLLALGPGDHVVAPRVMYWALRNWLVTDGRRWGLEVDLVDTEDLDAVRAAVRPGATRLVWVETPANPLWSLTDIAAVAAIAHDAGAVLAVDSTCATPILTRPLERGADIVMHSATKYLNGHSDVIAGALATARSDALWERIQRNRSTLGQILRPARGLSPDPRHADAASAGAGSQRLGHGAGGALPARGRGGRCSIQGCPAIPGTRSQRGR